MQSFVKAQYFGLSEVHIRCGQDSGQAAGQKGAMATFSIFQYHNTRALLVVAEAATWQQINRLVKIL